MATTKTSRSPEAIASVRQQQLYTREWNHFRMAMRLRLHHNGSAAQVIALLKLKMPALRLAASAAMDHSSAADWHTDIMRHYFWTKVQRNLAADIHAAEYTYRRAKERRQEHETAGADRAVVINLEIQETKALNAFLRLCHTEPEPE